MVNPCISRTLGGIPQYCSLLVDGKKTLREADQQLGIPPPPPGEDLGAVVLDLVDEYIVQRQNTVAKYIVTWPILEIFIGIERMTG